MNKAMNYITYADGILSDFKHLTRQTMKNRIFKLLELHKSFILAVKADPPDSEKMATLPELTRLAIIDKKVQKTIVDKMAIEFESIVNGSFETSVQKIVDSDRFSGYDKARAMLYITKRYPGMHPVSDIPEQFACEFLMLVDMHKEVVYNEDCTMYGYNL
jgi:hypothetical protein